MSRPANTPTGRESFFDRDEIIVSKTDLRGIITYANDVFQRVSGYSEAELLGQPHNLIRHPDIPGCVFRLLWETLEARQEIFAYVDNLARDGSHYWVFAHVTPSYDATGRHVGYHSNRRVPFPDALDKVRPLYAELREIERRHRDRREAVAASFEHLQNLLRAAGLSYGEFVFSLSSSTQLAAAHA